MDNHSTMFHRTGGPDFGKLIGLGKLGSRVVIYGSTNGNPSSFNIYKFFLTSMKMYEPSNFIIFLIPPFF